MVNGKAEGIDREKRPRLLHLDGLRGFAALFVVAHHFHQEIFYLGDIPHRFVAALKWLQLGHFAVAVFIVLSGYSLMLPVARSPEQQLQGGFKEYIRRRGRRILPPYYAAMLFTIGLTVLFPSLGVPSGGPWDLTLPVGPVSLLSHCLLIHNLSPNWIYKLNSPMWSVATEWQIYFFFPFILLPLWRRAGVLVTVAIACALGLLIELATRGQLTLAAPWYLGLFAMGMAGACMNFSASPSLEALSNRLPWGLLAMVSCGVFIVLSKFRPEWPITADFVMGLATTALLVYCTHANRQAGSRPAPVLRLLQSPWAVGLGTMSYSVYLIHLPLLTLTSMAMKRIWSPSPVTRLWLLPALAMPLILVSSYLFHLVFERPFMKGLSSKRPAEVKTVVFEPSNETTVQLERA
jgi:peptidoglycan/LPS O-acetylase OafA/YrhL